MGTPHLGSPVAGFGATIAYLTGFLGSNTGLLLLLRSNGEMLVNLSIAFQACLEKKHQDLDRKTKIISICEQKPTYLLNWLYAGMVSSFTQSFCYGNVLHIADRPNNFGNVWYQFYGDFQGRKRPLRTE